MFDGVRLVVGRADVGEMDDPSGSFMTLTVVGPVEGIKGTSEGDNVAKDG